MKALVVRFSAIGDCVMAVPVATAIRRKYPDGFLAWAIEARCADVVDDEELVDWRQVFPRTRWKKGRWSPTIWLEQLRTYSGLRKVRFDIGIDLQGHSKTAFCLRLAGPRKRIAAYATDSLARRLNPLASGDPRGTHTVEWALGALNQLEEFGCQVRYSMPKLAQERAETTKLIGEGPPFVSISIAAGTKGKTYPLNQWEEVAVSIAKGGKRAVFLGGPGDPHSVEGAGVDLVGRLTLAQSMAVIATSQAHLAGDTGGGHIAAGYGVPVISIFGPSSPARYRPYTERGAVLQSGAETKNVTPADILEALAKLLEVHANPVSH